MTDPNSAIPDHVKPAFWARYEAWRVRTYEKTLAKNARRLPGMRNRRGARILAAGVLVSLLLLLAASVMSFVLQPWYFIPFGAGLVGVLGFLRLLAIVTGNIAEAPVASLDELQLAKRNSARSIGYIVLFGLMFVPYLALIFVGSAFDSVSGDTVYGFGILLITFMLIGTCSPTLLLAWWTEDPDPEDFVDGPSADSQPAAVGEPAERTTPTPGPQDPVAAETTTSHRGDDSPFDPPAPARW
jgi:protein-S-isoprenylcysteine O-methyltransferase Ste14